MSSPVHKKANLFVRGSDNVFRRKSQDSSISEPCDPRKPYPSSNELIALGFQLADSALPGGETKQHENQHGHPTSDQGFTSTKTSTLEPTSNLTTKKAYTSGSASGSMTNTEKGAKVAMNSIITSISNSVSSIGIDNISDRIVPFISGMVFMYIVQMCGPFVSYYFGILFHLLKVALVWAAISVAGLWYTGRLPAFLLSEIKKSIAITLAAPADIPSPSPDPIGNTLQPKFKIPNHAGARPKANERSRSRDQLPTRKSRTSSPVKSTQIESRSKITSLRQTTPMVRKKMAGQKLQSLPNLLSPTPNTCSRISTSPERPIDRDRRHSSSSAELLDRDSKHKHLPPIPRRSTENTDGSVLPLLCQMEVQETQNDETSQHLHRLDTMMSKTSILGTRANYTKFLANVNEV